MSAELAPTDGEPADASFAALLGSARAGDAHASWRIFELLQADLRACASRLMRGQAHGHTLQSMDLVNEVCVRAQRAGPRAWNDRTHALLCLTEAMRNVLRDHARRKSSGRRSPTGVRVPLDVIVESYATRNVDFDAYHDRLEQLAALDPRLAIVVDLRIGQGYSMQEIADVLGVSKRTVERDWEAALACLRPVMG
jgi:RNA polymerase sigma factor (TIGR02999 family)